MTFDNWLSSSKFTQLVDTKKHFRQNKSAFSIKCSEDQSEHNSKKLDLLVVCAHKVLKRKYIVLDLVEPSGALRA